MRVSRGVINFVIYENFEQILINLLDLRINVGRLSDVDSRFRSPNRLTRAAFNLAPASHYEI